MLILGQSDFQQMYFNYALKIKDLNYRPRKRRILNIFFSKQLKVFRKFYSEIKYYDENPFQIIKKAKNSITKKYTIFAIF